MRRFGWTRLAWLFLVLTVIAALVRLGGAEARSLAARMPDALAFASESREEPTAVRLTEEDLSSLEDMRGEPLPTQSSAGPAKPPLSSYPVGAARPAKENARTESADGPPVFYRPAGSDAGAGPVCGDLRGAPEGSRIVFPLERQFFFFYEDTWGAPRAQGGHEGTDLMTPKGVPEYAITDGTVVPVDGSDADGWNTLGGNAVMVRADHSLGPVKAGDLFYYAHLEEGSPLEIGDRVNAGQVVGYAGDTGQGPPGTSGLFPPHLHLGWYDGTGGREEADSGAMNPYPLLEWIRSNGGAVSGGSGARYCEAPRTGPPTPSSGNDWPDPSKPGLTPDLDTGSGDPHPPRATAGDKNPPAKEPVRPDRPTNKNVAKPDRPEVQKPQRPEKNPPKPARPNKDEQTPPKPAPPEKDPSRPDPSPAPPHAPDGPSNGQYDSAAGEPDRPPAPKPKHEPEAAGKPTARDDKEPTSKEKVPNHQLAR